MCWRLYWMDSTKRYIMDLDKWVKYPEKTLLKKEGKTVFHSAVTLSWRLLILVNNSHKKQKDRCALARCYQHSQASWCVKGRIYRFSIPCSCRGGQKKKVLGQELLLFTILKAPSSHRGRIMHVVQLRAGVPPSIPEQTWMLKAGRQHRPDSSLSLWDLPGASEQSYQSWVGRPPLKAYGKEKTLKHFPSSGRTEKENIIWCRHEMDIYTGLAVSPLKSNLFNIPIKQIMHCWHGGKEYSLTVLIVQAMWIKFSIIYSFSVTCLCKKMRYDKGYYNLLGMFDKSCMENKRSSIEKAHKFLL